VRLAEERALVEFLRAGRDVDGRVLVEEVDGFHRHSDDFAGHDGEVFDARDLQILWSVFEGFYCVRWGCLRG